MPRTCSLGRGAAFLEDRGAEVHVERLQAGHNLTTDDEAAVTAWRRAHVVDGT